MEDYLEGERGGETVKLAAGGGDIAAGAMSTRSGVGGGELKKGPWTQVEDKLLVDHVRRHGEGNWNAVRRETGLQRCGKSCRLRWANHLRPNLRKGPFSPEEERLILRLHGLIGNKWARISSHLLGRTDNEVKNYWNTRLKRRQRAGQSLYPPEIEREIALLRAQNLNPFADADSNGNARASLPAPLLLDASNPFALPPTAPSPSASASAAHSPLINQNYPLLNQMQGLQLLHHANHQVHGGPQQPVLHHDGAELGHGGFISAGLPPLPTRAHERPTNQFDTASCSGGGGGGDGLLESLLLGNDHHLPRPNHAMCRVGSMPELMYSRYPSSSLLQGGAASDSDVTSQYPPGEDRHHRGKWDFLFDDVKPTMRRAASAVVEEQISDMFGIAPGSIPGEWFSTAGGSTAPSPGPSSVVTTDDEFSLEMQQFMSSLPLSPADELYWNA